MTDWKPNQTSNYSPILLTEPTRHGNSSQQQKVQIDGKQTYYLQQLQEKFYLYPDLAKQHIQEELVSERALIPYVNINDFERVKPTPKIKSKPIYTQFKQQAEKYKKGELKLLNSDLPQMMNELKSDWQIKEKINSTQPIVTYNAHVKNIRNTILAQLRQEFVNPRVRLVSQRSKIDEMKVTITSLHQQSHAKSIRKFNRSTESQDPELDQLLSRVSPEYLNKFKTKDDEQVLSQIIPHIVKKPRKPVSNQDQALTLACRRKFSIEQLVAEPQTDQSTSDLTKSRKKSVESIKKYKEFVQKKGSNGRVVLLYNGSPSWHTELDHSIKMLDQTDFTEEINPQKVDSRIQYNTQEQFDELEAHLDELEKNQFSPSEELTQVLHEADSQLALMSLPSVKTVKKVLNNKKEIRSPQDLFIALERKNNETAIKKQQQSNRNLSSIKSKIIKQPNETQSVPLSNKALKLKLSDFKKISRNQDYIKTSQTHKINDHIMNQLDELVTQLSAKHNFNDTSSTFLADKFILNQTKQRRQTINQDSSKLLKHINENSSVDVLQKFSQTNPQAFSTVNKNYLPKVQKRETEKLQDAINVLNQHVIHETELKYPYIKLAGKTNGLSWKDSSVKVQMEELQQFEHQIDQLHAKKSVTDLASELYEEPSQFEMQPVFSKKFNLNNVNPPMNTLWNTQSTSFNSQINIPLQSFLEKTQSSLKVPEKLHYQDLKTQNGLERLRQERIERDFKNSMGAELMGLNDREIPTYSWNQFKKDASKQSTLALMTYKHKH